MPLLSNMEKLNISEPLSLATVLKSIPIMELSAWNFYGSENLYENVYERWLNLKKTCIFHL